jgi:hypothetical protein
MIYRKSTSAAYLRGAFGSQANRPTGPHEYEPQSTPQTDSRTTLESAVSPESDLLRAKRGTWRWRSCRQGYGGRPRAPTKIRQDEFAHRPTSPYLQALSKRPIKT